MNILIRSYTSEIASQLELLTLGAELVPSAIAIDEHSSSIAIPMKRKHYRRKRLLSGAVEGYERVSPDTTESLLLVRDVHSHESYDRLSLESISLLFGVKLTDNEVYLCSVEESKGTAGFELRIKIRSHDIELRDKV